MKKRLAILAIAGAMAISTLTGCGGINDSDTVATVEGDDISVGLANFYARMTQAQYETYYAGYLGEDMWSSEASEGESYEEAVKNQVMEDLQNMYLLEDHMDEYDVSISEEEQTAIEKAAAAFDEANGLEEKDKVSGSKENVERFLTLTTIRQKMSNAIKAAADVEVSDEEAAQKAMKYVMFSYTTTDEDGNSAAMTEDEQAALKEEAESFAKEAKSADDFAAFASEKGYEAKDATFDADETIVIPAELAKAADALEEGGVTDVIETDNGLYVAKVTSLFDEDATETEKQNLISQKQQEKYDEIIEAWREEADISVKKNVWKKVDFNELSVTLHVDESDPYADSVKTDDQAEDSTADDEADETDTGETAE
ncbi:MAG: peptidyl-prolyl cis-trans isomerase [Eubacteriales bacterium]|nr:peptidyl-prolyl cis-trans isomerase [Eubacteriales bacterium]